MNNFMSWSEKHLIPLATKLDENRYISAVKGAMILTIPFLIVGSIFLIINAFPIPAYTEFMMNNPIGMQIRTWMGYATAATFDTVAMVTLAGVAYYLSEHYGLDRIISVGMAFISYFVVTPLFFSVEGVEGTISGLSKGYMGSQALFVAIIVGLVSVDIMKFFLDREITIKMPDSVPPAVSKSFESLIPAFFVLTFFLIVRILLEITGVGSIHDVITALLTEPLSRISGTLPGAIVITFMIHFLWSFGIHGAAITWAVMQPVLNIMLDANRIAFESGIDIPNVLTKEWFNIFIMMGGSGGTLMLVFMMTFLAKSDQLKQLGRLSIGPGIFNINEPIIFGLPIVMNPIMMIPFIFGPILITIITYLAMQWELVAKVVTIIPWSTPPIIGGFLITGGHVSGAVLQAINLLVLALIYYPFFKVYDSQLLTEQMENDKKGAL